MTKTHWIITIETDWARPDPLRPVSIAYFDGIYSITSANDAVMFLAGNLSVGDPCGWNSRDELEHTTRLEAGDPDGGVRFRVKECYEDGSHYMLENGNW